MCLLFLAIDAHPDFPIVAAANRDEFYDRPTRQMHTWEDHGQVIAGRDLDKGGTWFGVTRQGRWAAVTNFREEGTTSNHASRGALVSDYLVSGASPADYTNDIVACADSYCGFNLVVGNLSQAVYFSNRENGVQHLTRGVYGLSNHLLDTPWPKVRKGKERLLHFLQSGRMDSDTLFSILNDPTRAADEGLPNAGPDIEFERLLSSAFIRGDAYGTRSSTVFLANSNNRLKLEERTYDPDVSRSPGGFSGVAYEFDAEE